LAARCEKAGGGAEVKEGGDGAESAGGYVEARHEGIRTASSLE
jgi:hypothetical protein